MRLQSMRMLRLILLVLLMTSLAWFCTGCQPIINSGQDQQPGAMVKIEVHFTGGSQPLTGYVRSLNIDQEGMFFQGGSSTIPIYDEQGNLQAVVNYSRIEYFKIVP